MQFKNNTSIIILIDFSSKSISAIENIYLLAKSINAKIILIFAGSESEHFHKDEINQIIDKAKNVTALEIEYVYFNTNIFKQTLQKINQVNCSLFVMCLNVYTKLNYIFDESDVFNFLKTVNCPVLTIPSLNSQFNFKNILIHIDLSAESREKVGVVVQLSKIFSSNINIICVYPPNDIKYENKILPYVIQVKKYIKEHGLNCSNKSICSKNIPDSIINYAIENDCGLIIQMNKKNKTLKELFFDTCSNIIIKKSTIPVLSINPMKRESISSGIH